MSSGGEIERCREVVKERRAPAVFGAAWHGRGVNGWADADLLTSLLQIVTIGQAFKCTYRELPFPAVSFIPTVNCLGRTRLTCSFIERCSSRPKRGCPANMRHPLAVPWAICTVCNETCTTRGRQNSLQCFLELKLVRTKWQKHMGGLKYQVVSLMTSTLSH